MPKIEVAIWHPTMTAAEIERRIGMQPRISLSVDEQRTPGSGVRTETYCRFDLGVVRLVKTKADLHFVEAFRGLLCSPEFAVPGANAIAYFAMVDRESEIYLGKSGIELLSGLGLGVVLRERKTRKPDKAGS